MQAVNSGRQFMSAPAAAADAMANPTAGGVLSFGMGFNGSTWDRLTSTTANGLDVDVTRVQGTVTVGDGGSTISVDDGGGSLTVDGSVSVSGSVDTELPTAAALADNASNPTAPAVGAFGMVWDGSTWDRQPGNSAGGTFVQGPAAHDAAVAGSPQLMGGFAKTAAPTNVSADGDAVWAWFDRAGRQAVWDGDLTLSVDDGGSSLTVDGTVGVSGTVTVDSEMSAAAAAADAFANPTSGGVLAFNMGYNGSTWDRLRSSTANGLVVDVSRVQGTVTVGDGGGTISIDDGGGSITVDGSVTAAFATNTTLTFSTKTANGTASVAVATGAKNGFLIANYNGAVPLWAGGTSSVVVGTAANANGGMPIAEYGGTLGSSQVDGYTGNVYVITDGTSVVYSVWTW